MDWSCVEHLMDLQSSGRMEDVIRESKILLANTSNPDEKASLLGGILVAWSCSAKSFSSSSATTPLVFSVMILNGVCYPSGVDVDGVP
jgi:hypothetical protein